MDPKKKGIWSNIIVFVICLIVNTGMSIYLMNIILEDKGNLINLYKE